MWREIIHPNDRSRIIKEIEEANRLHTKYEHEYRILTKNNKIKWIKENFINVKNKVTHKYCYVGIFSDITKEVKQKEIDDLVENLINTELQQGLWCYNENDQKFIFFQQRT